VDFVAVVDQAIALLRQRGRLTYRTLQLQFQLDAEHLEALKDELIKGQRLALDEDGAVLVWTGDTATPVSPASPASMSASPPAASPPEAERRQLTVLFCDLVDSTTLSTQLDPEEYRDVVRAYHTACTEVIHHYDGHIAQLLGDGLLVYFGYPQAHEDDAQRAVRTGLAILAAMGELNTHLQQDKRIQLALRMGIHTGQVVVGALGGAGRQEQLALGEVPNIASRIEGLAAPNTIAISDATYRLVQGYFDCQDLGTPALRGVTASMRVYHVLRESGATSRLDVAQLRGLTPLVGRESEIALLLERWAQAKSGQGQVVLLTGDAGIGKSRLVHMLKDHVTQEPHVRWECRSTEYAQNSALYPVIDLFQRLWQFEAQEPPDAQWAKLAHALSQYQLPLEESIPLFAPLLSVPLPAHHSPALHLSPQRQRQKTLETVVALLLELAERQPVLFILEDLHWTDPTTLEWLHLLIEQTPTASMLVLLTCRPHFHPRWSHKSYLSEVTVHRLSQPQIERMTTYVAGGTPLPTSVLAQIAAKTDGVPLFVEEITKAMLESGPLQDVDGHAARAASVRTLTIPATLHDSLMARLDRLATVKGLAQLGATLGREFSYALLRAVAPWDEDTIQRGLHQLIEAEFLYQRGVLPQATYTFKHALIQDVAYNSLLLRQRRAFHRAVGAAMEELYPTRLAEHYAEVAHHFTQGEAWAKAMAYSTLAGEQAAAAFANAEARAHYARALQAAAQGTPSVEPGTLARLHAKYGAVLVVLGEQEEAEATYHRALALIQQTADRHGEIAILAELSEVYRRAHRDAPAVAAIEQALALARALGDRAGEARCLATRVYLRTSGYGQLVAMTPDAEEALHLARVSGDPKAVAEALVSLGRVLQWRGVFDRSLGLLQEGVDLARRTHAGFLSGVAAFFLGNAYTARGAYEDALAWYQQLSAYASTAGDRRLLARVPNVIGGVHLELFDLDEALRLNLEGAEVAQQYDPWPEPCAHSLVKAGLASLYRGEHGPAEACLRRAEALLEADTWLRWRWQIALLHAWGELALTQGHPDQAWSYAIQALALATQTDSRKHITRAQRLQGAILAARGRLEEAVQTLATSVQVAAQMQTPREMWLGQAALGTVLLRLGRDQEAEAHLTQATHTIEAIATTLHTPRLRHSFLGAAPVLEVYAVLGHRPPPHDTEGG
jgi:class 3 adenylate cyclase/tetratricopeptide (TPR) repeat protein